MKLRQIFICLFLFSFISKDYLIHKIIYIMKHLKVFNTKAEYQAYYANNRIPSSVLVYVKEDNIIAFSSNNVNGEFSKYSNEDGGGETQPNNQIWYTTTDGNIITPTSATSIGTLVSNTYEDGKGIMTFEEDLTYLYKIFYSSSTLESVIIPNSVTTIKEEAFNFCSSLTSVTIPNSVTSIGDFAFGNCTSLTSITIPNNLTEINSIFGGTSLSSIEIPYSVSKIEGSFYCVETLTSVTYDGSSEQWYNIEINSDAFYGIGTTEVNCTDGTYPIYQRSEVEDYEENITRFLNSTNQDYTEQQFDGGLDTWALIDYNYSQYDTLNIGTGVTTIHSNLFQQEENLQYYIKYVTIPNSVSSIRNDAFSNIYLEKIRIGNGVTYIGENAFSGNGNLTDVYYNGTMEEWQTISIYSGVFDSTNVQLIHCTDGDYSL